MIKGGDGRDVLQMRVDMGLLQLETTGRPDGREVEKCGSCLELIRTSKLDDSDFELSEKQRGQVDREFMQFYHRRICWLRLQFYHRAVMDADHTLQLMDACEDVSDDSDWLSTHEQYRPFVLFHRTQAEALGRLEEESPETAVQSINAGLDQLRGFFVKHDAEEHFDDDELIQRLIELRESLRKEYKVGPTLAERLNEAVANEKYELAAKLRDELTKRDTF